MPGVGHGRPLPQDTAVLTIVFINDFMNPIVYSTGENIYAIVDFDGFSRRVISWELTITCHGLIVLANASATFLVYQIGDFSS